MKSKKAKGSLQRRESDGSKNGPGKPRRFSKFKAKPRKPRERTAIRKKARLEKKARSRGHVILVEEKQVEETLLEENTAPAISEADVYVNTSVQKRQKQAKDQQRSLLKEQKKRRVENLLADNESEDRNIKALERKLKINKRKSKSIPNAFIMDGLDYILEACERGNTQPELELDNVESNFDNDVAMMTGKALKSTKKKKENPAVVAANNQLKLDQSGEPLLQDPTLGKPSKNKKVTFVLPSNEDSDDQETVGSHHSEEGDSDSCVEDSENEMSSGESDNCDSNEMDKFVMDLWDDDDEDDDKGDTQDLPEQKSPSPKNDEIVREDIYGRVIGGGPSAMRCMPPELLNSDDPKKSEDLFRLSRQLKGFLNRLSESSMMSMSNEIEKLYMKNSRNDMNETLTKLVMEASVQVSATPERLVQELAFLVSLLHANVGTEVGARFLEAIIEKLNIFLNDGANYGEGKKCDNLILLLIHLYNFGVVHSQLIYDILHKFADSFCEKDIDLIVLILRGAGFTLRKDDAISLKNIILKVQSKSGNATLVQDQTRVKFMLEILMAVRNNNMHKIPNCDTSHADHLKKLLKTFLRKGNSVQRLQISLEDLSNVQLRGRWWVVGSAWTGMKAPDNVAENKITKDSGAQTISDDILALARQQRMHTDIRKNIFSIIMTSDDYLAAFENLVNLGLKNVHEREIICVIIDCGLQEKIFNPYYAHLLQRFCEADSKYKIMTQCAFWDKIKEIHSVLAIQISNMAQLLLHLLLTKALSIAVLKIIQFSEMEKNMVRFLRQTLLGLLLHPSEEEFSTVLMPVAKSPKLHMFRVGLCLFMRHFILKNKDKLASDMQDQLSQRVDMADSLFSSQKSIAML